jgi:sugar O-acyltransferase (sialic acid O-acetyltransferase NeuD family)
MTTLAILGASGHGKVVADAALLTGKWKQVVFFDDAYPNIHSVGDWPVLGATIDLIYQSKKYNSVVIAIGNNATRLLKQQVVVEGGCEIVSVVHPSATVSSRAVIEKGTVVMAGAVVNPFSVIGESCIINSNSVVEHDCILESGVHISPGCLLGGGVRIGLRSWIGIGSCIKQLISICDDVTVGSGAVVVKNVTEAGVYTGIPARKVF